MAKKNKNSGAYRQEKTIEERNRMLRQDSLVFGAGVTLILGYVLMTVQQYMANNRRVGFSAAMSGAMEEMAKNPLYFLGFLLDPEYNNTYNFGLTFTAVLIVALFLFVSYTYDKIRNHGRIDTIKGSARWADKNYLIHKYADFEGKDYKHAYNNVILSQDFQMSMNHNKHYHALNTLLIGATGTGKSRFILKPNLLQMNASYVVTDPKGAILNECGEALRRFGYNVRVFDLVNMGNCDTYNPLKYCKRESDIKKIVQAFMKNTDSSGGQGGNKDPFWDDSMSAFLCACIGLLTSKPEGSDLAYGQIPEIVGRKDPVTGEALTFSPVFANLCEITRMANRKWEKDSGPALYGNVKLGDGKNNTANASELAAIFENLRAWESERQGVSPEEMVKPYCLREWENFRIAPEKTSTTILMTTAVRLDPFNIEQVKDLTSSDTICLDEFGLQRDVLFVIIPTNDRTYNFLVSFLYTQLFDQIYFNCENNNIGSKNLVLPCGELVKHFTKQEVEKGDVEQEVALIRNAKMVKQTAKGILHGTGKNKKGKEVKVSFDDGWYDIVAADGTLVTRRPDKATAEKYLADLKHAKLKNAKGIASPTHVRFLLDEFANIGEIPEFKEKLATMRAYEISCMVICQSITQLKGMYEKDYEVIDANCPQKIFLGGDENSNNEYFSKKLGNQTVKSSSSSVDSKKVSQSVPIEQKPLMSPDELGRMEYAKQLVIIFGEQPLMDNKYDYPKHKNYKYTNDYCCDIGCSEGSVYDRSHYEKLKNLPLMIRSISASAVPDCQEFTEDSFLSIFRGVTQDDAARTARSCAEKYIFEAQSEAGAY